MLTAFFQINAKEVLRGTLDATWAIIWAFKWYFLAIIGINLVAFILERLLHIKIFRIIFTAVLVLAIIGFFVWLYS